MKICLVYSIWITSTRINLIKFKKKLVEWIAIAIHIGFNASNTGNSYNMFTSSQEDILKNVSLVLQNNIKIFTPLEMGSIQLCSLRQ